MRFSSLTNCRQPDNSRKKASRSAVYFLSRLFAPMTADTADDADDDERPKKRAKAKKKSKKILAYYLIISYIAPKEITTTTKEREANANPITGRNKVQPPDDTATNNGTHRQNIGAPTSPTSEARSRQAPKADAREHQPDRTAGILLRDAGKNKPRGNSREKTANDIPAQTADESKARRTGKKQLKNNRPGNGKKC